MLIVIKITVYALAAGPLYAEGQGGTTGQITAHDQLGILVHLFQQAYPVESTLDQRWLNVMTLVQLNQNCKKANKDKTFIHNDKQYTCNNCQKCNNWTKNKYNTTLDCSATVET